MIDKKSESEKIAFDAGKNWKTQQTALITNVRGLIGWLIMTTCLIQVGVYALCRLTDAFLAKKTMFGNKKILLEGNVKLKQWKNFRKAVSTRICHFKIVILGLIDAVVQWWCNYRRLFPSSHFRQTKLLQNFVHCSTFKMVPEGKFSIKFSNLVLQIERASVTRTFMKLAYT